MDLKLVIFDMDGVLLDTERLANKAWVQAGKIMKIDINDSILRRIKGGNIKNTSNVIKDILNNNKADELIQKKKKIEKEIIKSEGIQLKIGVFEILKFLKSRNILRVVATSTEKKIAEKELKEAGIYEYFNGFIFGDEVEKGKPNPEIFIKACNLFGISSQNSIVFEDSLLGLRAAISGNIKCIVIEDTVKLTYEEEMLAFKKFSNLLEVKNFLEKI